MMKIRTVTLVLLLLGLVAGVAAAPQDEPGQPAPEANTDASRPSELLIDRIIAVVGDDIVLLSELRIEAEKLAARLRQKGVSPMPSTAAIQKQAFDTLVLNKLQLAEAARLGIEADEETISRAISAVASNNKMSVPELRDALASEGMAFDTFRSTLRDEIIIRRLRNREVTNRIEVTKSEIDSYLERSGGDGRSAVNLRYILIAAPESRAAEREEARVEATGIVERLRKGEPFAPLAQQYSDDQTGLQGGDLGWLDVNSIPPLFQAYVARMKKGDTEGPIASSGGFHIVQLVDVRYDNSKIVQQTHARHILVRTNEVTSDADARQRLEQLRQRIVDGDDFDTLARSNSDDKASAIKGGDLGWSTPGNLVPEFEEQMDLLAIDEISRPFKTQFGWHIVQVLGRRSYDATDETRRDQARKAVRDEKADEALRTYLRQLRDEAYIELRLDELG